MTSTPERRCLQKKTRINTTEMDFFIRSSTEKKEYKYIIIRFLHQKDDFYIRKRIYTTEKDLYTRKRFLYQKEDFHRKKRISTLKREFLH